MINHLLAAIILNIFRSLISVSYTHLDVYKRQGLNMILFLMGLQNVQPEVLEAAKIDGANEWQTFTRIILPLLKPITTVVIILNIIGSFKIFDIIWVMTAGGPARSAETLAVSMYKESFSLYRMGYGSSIAVLLSFIVFAVGIGYLRIAGREK